MDRTMSCCMALPVTGLKNSLHLYLWGTLKSVVFAGPFSVVQILEQCINAAYDAIRIQAGTFEQLSDIIITVSALGYFMSLPEGGRYISTSVAQSVKALACRSEVALGRGFDTRLD
ncbi:hypothetical protein ANN_14319 [Periplaneta americana]|uniref:Uncharacterized protein n=1 Tax=Periplaneta americana TaxID=6978 RepID=A0ABQ8SVZ2_PERAM|nr:hypothetical protein ANN_14319 [Periplaneta americana]